MKAVNITAQQRPDSHSQRPPSRRLVHKPRPRQASSPTARLNAVKKLRQKVTSKLRALSRCRVTTPAILHSSVTSTISPTA